MQLMPAFQKMIVGMSEGERKKERYEASDCYGEWLEEQTYRIENKARQHFVHPCVWTVNQFLCVTLDAFLVP
jgi:FKBP-type peptidyl-prolyl cis-trans isomerase 2